MKVKATINLGALDYPEHLLMNGEVAEVPEPIACKMVARGHAVEIIEPMPVAIVPPEAEPEQEPVKPETKPHKTAVTNSKGK